MPMHVEIDRAFTKLLVRSSSRSPDSGLPSPESGQTRDSRVWVDFRTFQADSVRRWTAGCAVPECGVGCSARSSGAAGSSPLELPGSLYSAISLLWASAASSSELPDLQGTPLPPLQKRGAPPSCTMRGALKLRHGLLPSSTAFLSAAPSSTQDQSRRVWLSPTAILVSVGVVRNNKGTLGPPQYGNRRKLG